MAYNTKCKYCGCKIKGGEMCSGCAEKLPLVRKLQRMVKDAKEQVEREQITQDDVSEVRSDG